MTDIILSHRVTKKNKQRAILEYADAISNCYSSIFFYKGEIALFLKQENPHLISLNDLNIFRGHIKQQRSLMNFYIKELNKIINENELRYFNRLRPAICGR